jgi:hypothetical protein
MATRCGKILGSLAVVGVLCVSPGYACPGGGSGGGGGGGKGSGGGTGEGPFGYSGKTGGSRSSGKSQLNSQAARQIQALRRMGYYRDANTGQWMYQATGSKTATKVTSLPRV